jgi:aspartate aminotransferase-like enzyme
MEGCISSMLAGNGKAVVGNCGKFGERWLELCEAFGVPCQDVFVPRGRAVKPEMMAQAVEADQDIRAVLLTLTETSTGVCNDIQAICQRLEGWDGMVIVDAISGLVADELRMDDWGVDMVVVGSQKGLMLPPGLAMVAISAKARKMLESRAGEKKRGCYYLDLLQYLHAYERATDVPYTPAISLIRGLEESVTMLLEEGIEAVWARHQRVASAVRDACVAMGFELFAAERRSNAVTAALPPEGLDAGKIIKNMVEKKGIRLASGQGEYKGKMVRIAHLGACYEEDVLGLIGAMESCLRDLGWSLQTGVGVAAAETVLTRK